MAQRMILPSRFIKATPQRGTVAIRNQTTGRFRGRKPVDGRGDRTKARRVLHDVDVNRDGKVDFFGGTIEGRTDKSGLIKGSSVSVKASRRARGYERRV